MSGDDEGRTGTRISAGLAVLAVLFLLYVLSYAPVMQMTATHSPPTSYHPPQEGYQSDSYLYSTHHWSYAPVRWLTASTPLREPLLMWGDLWGMRDVLENSEHWTPQ
jgi:hypothetical protein